jgi:flagellar protein FliO/FliZ
MGGAGGSLLGAFLGVLAATAAVLGLAWLVLRGVKSWRDRQPGGDPGASLRFVRALPLGPRERAVLIEANSERLLLGVAEGGVSVLARWRAEPGTDGPAYPGGDKPEPSA